MDAADEQPVFAAELTAHRSLGRKGFRALLLVAGAVCLLYGLFFIISGAWPVGLFFGLDFLLLYAAFRINYRSGRRREEVTVTRNHLSIRKVSPAGRVDEHRFDPLRARFGVDRHTEFGITAMHVSGDGRRTEIGSFLNPEDRASFAAALAGALAAVRRGSRRA